MKTKNCPFCGKEISDEAIICKFCHRLLIDENGNDILPEGEIPEAEEEAAVSEEKTIVYKKDDLKKLMEKQEPAEDEDDLPEDGEDTFSEEDDSDEGGYEYEDDEENDTSAVIDSGSEDSEYDGSGDDYEQADGGEDDGFPEDDEYGSTDEDGEGYGYDDYEPEKITMSKRPARRSRDDDRYDDADLAAAADYDPKRTFIVTAVVTLGILLIIIVAILVGYKLFGFGKGGDTTEKTPLAENKTSTAADAGQSSAADTVSNAAVSGAGDSSFVPSVVNDTLSENPEEILNSAASDPVVDSAATTPEASAPDSAAPTESGVNIVIRPDPNATDSTTASGTDSQTPGDGPSSSTTSSAAPAGPGAPGFQAAGSYYSWNEANDLMAAYASSNGLGNYEYYSGTDGVEMLYAVYDDFGNATIYRVDLQTGYVSAY